MLDSGMTQKSQAVELSKQYKFLYTLLKETPANNLAYYGLMVLSREWLQHVILSKSTLVI